MPRAAALPALEDVLRLHGVAIVKAGNIYQVMPLSEAPRSATVPMTFERPSMQAPGYGVEVVPLKFVAASQMGKGPRLGGAGGQRSYVDTKRNLLILGGTSDQLASLLDMVAIFDVDVMRGMSFALVALEHSDAAAVTTEVEKIFNINKENPDGATRFDADYAAQRGACDQRRDGQHRPRPRMDQDSRSQRSSELTPLRLLSAERAGEGGRLGVVGQVVWC